MGSMAMSFLGWVFDKGWRLIFSVVIPVTIWFTLINRNISDVKAAQMEHRLRIDKIEIKVDANNAEISEKLSQIMDRLGEVQGELKRIK